MAMLSHLLHVSRNFEILYDMFGPGLRERCYHSLRGFQLSVWNLVGPCIPWSRLLYKMAMLSQFLCISWNFEFYHDRLGPGLGDDITALTLLKDFSYQPEILWDDTQYHWAGYYLRWLCSAIFCASTGLRNFPWQVKIRSERRWLSISMIRQKVWYLVAWCNVPWNRSLFVMAIHFLILASQGCCGSLVVICKMIIYPNIVVSVTAFETLMWYILLLSGINYL